MRCASSRCQGRPTSSLNPEHNVFPVGSELEALFDLRANTGSDFSRPLGQNCVGGNTVTLLEA
jgi:hypothetical protein